MLTRVALALLLVVAIDWAPGIPPLPLHSVAQVKAQAPYPPDAWHPYRGGRNCIQVADANGNFNCAAGTTVDPATGNMVVGGTLAFTGLLPGTFVNGLALAPLGTTVQLLGPGDLFISTSGSNIATSGGLAGGVTLRVRRGPGGSCQLVAAGGNGFQEFIIPVVSSATLGFITPQSQDAPNLLTSFPGGPAGC